MLTLADRAAAYTETFPKYPPLAATETWLYGVWMIGSYYKAEHGFYGEYPPSYLRRVRSLFPDVSGSEVLHLFSGAVGQGVHDGVTYDLNPELTPDHVADVMELSLIFPVRRFDLVLADPPYSNADYEKYGTPPFSKRLALREVAKVVRPGGFLCWLDLSIPIYRKVEWKLVGTIALLTGTNRKVRVLSIFQRAE